MKEFGVCESTATSSDQGNTSHFELTFHDERYLPFEFSKAVSRWPIELPQESKQFELDTLSSIP